MSDEPIIRLEPRRSRHGSDEDPRKYTGILRSMLRIVQMSKRGNASAAPSGGARSIRVGRDFHQRVAVRVSYARNKNPGQWKAHGRYVARDSATQKGRAAEAGFDRFEDRIDVAATLDNWQKAGDERLFKIIVSPEFGDRLSLRDYARKLMGRMEQDLGTQLEWVGAVHHNTEHAHVHLAVRGVDAKGIPFRLPREYIRSGLRVRAEEIATEILGYRSPAHAREAREREVVQKRYTSLDRILQWNNDGSSAYFVVTVNPDSGSLPESSRELQRQLAARLMHLQKMGLAHFLGEHQWGVTTDFEKVLRTLQQSADRQKMLAAHGAILSDTRLPLQITILRPFHVVSGRILLHTEDEQTGRRYMLVEGTDAKVHLIYHTAAIERARSEAKLTVNRFVRIEKRFEFKEPELHVDDLGDADALLEDSAYFRKEAERLCRLGIRHVQSEWGGWLGKYANELQAELRNLERGKRKSHERGGRST